MFLWFVILFSFCAASCRSFICFFYFHSRLISLFLWSHLAFLMYVLKRLSLLRSHGPYVHSFLLCLFNVLRASLALTPSPFLYSFLFCVGGVAPGTSSQCTLRELSCYHLSIYSGRHFLRHYPLHLSYDLSELFFPFVFFVLYRLVYRGCTVTLREMDCYPFSFSFRSRTTRVNYWLLLF
ncbi:hypothetical protein BDQ17DRAFT_1371917 [Cyathus striatus]|nr:hypothetical protein BDQ17DRAFT_1371917 [Cyathus striatus]